MALIFISDILYIPTYPINAKSQNIKTIPIYNLILLYFDGSSNLSASKTISLSGLFLDSSEGTLSVTSTTSLFLVPWNLLFEDNSLAKFYYYTHSLTCHLSCTRNISIARSLAILHSLVSNIIDNFFCFFHHFFSLSFLLFYFLLITYKGIKSIILL